MKYKVYNMVFMEAGVSFSSLKMYYDHVVVLLHQASDRMREAGKRTEAEYRKKQREYDRVYWEKFHKVFDEVYPGYIHNSFLISACSLFEHQVKKCRPSAVGYACSNVTKLTYVQSRRLQQKVIR